MIGRERWRFGTHPSRYAANACPVGGARTWPALAGLLATILASWVDFVPDTGLVIVSAILAVLPAWLLYWRRIRPGAQNRSLFKVDFACMLLLFAGTWSTLAVLLPASPILLVGPMTVERHVVLSRNTPWQQGLCHALRIDNLGWPRARAFCVGKAVWQASKPGQMMAIRVSRSSMGTYVHEMEPVCDGFVEQHLAAPKPTPFLRLPN
ncbi:MAG: hypothetical protein ABIG35_09060 [Pseudomonadota bacterium]